jgi:hypothetical protein
MELLWVVHIKLTYKYFYASFMLVLWKGFMGVLCTTRKKFYGHLMRVLWQLLCIFYEVHEMFYLGLEIVHKNVDLTFMQVS